ncbi:hypothetical protein CROQUDRAFT_55367, partial [Cronartium quercuum f. sp. fusiforme G11]
MIILKRPLPKIIKLKQSRLFLTVTNERFPICVAMSGGVDSAVSALILKKSNQYLIKSIFIKNWDHIDERSICHWKRDWEDVQLISKQLNISCELIDLSKAYWNRVWEPSLRIWESGGTPNPDIMCNRHIKFGLLADYILKSDPNTLLATGHYARLDHTNGRTKLYQSENKLKDQSYYLSTTSIKTFNRTIFPLDKIKQINKLKVRKIAKDNGLINFDKAESMGICLVAPNSKKFENFL